MYVCVAGIYIYTLFVEIVRLNEDCPFYLDIHCVNDHVVPTHTQYAYPDLIQFQQSHGQYLPMVW